MKVPRAHENQNVGLLVWGHQIDTTGHTTHLKSERELMGTVFYNMIKIKVAYWKILNVNMTSIFSFFFQGKSSNTRLIQGQIPGNPGPSLALPYPVTIPMWLGLALNSWRPGRPTSGRLGHAQRNRILQRWVTRFHLCTWHQAIQSKLSELPSLLW